MTISLVTGDTKTVTIDREGAPDFGASFDVRVMSRVDFAGIKLLASRTFEDEDGFSSYAQAILRKGIAGFDGLKDPDGNPIEFMADAKGRMLPAIIDLIQESTMYRMIEEIRKFNTVTGEELKK